MKIRSRALIFLLCLLWGTIANAQQEVDEQALIEVKDGVSISKDSLFLLNLRFRMQNRFGISTVSRDDLSIRSVDARVRRLRLRLDGFVLDRNFRYYIQLAFSRADLELEELPTAQPIRDAIVYYHFNRNFYLGFGQSKLPGNRERVISSGNLQFPDRSIANSAFTLDRDFGAFAYWTIRAAEQQVQLKGAVSSGEGRNALASDAGLAYTGRLEWLPLGEFTDKGDYSEGDLEFEPKPKISLAGSYSTNINAQRTGGQLGGELISPSDINTFIADMMFKYRGWAILGEYFDRRATVPISFDTDGEMTFVPSGIGINGQLSRVFKNGLEIATRFTTVQPNPAVDPVMRRTDELLLGSTKYLNEHRIKLQLSAGYRWFEGDPTHQNSFWTAMFQVEFGI